LHGKMRLLIGVAMPDHEFAVRTRPRFALTGGEFGRSPTPSRASAICFEI
jgi:hypothetical protein